jgi:hypothetical protein
MTQNEDTQKTENKNKKMTNTDPPKKQLGMNLGTPG